MPLSSDFNVLFGLEECAQTMLLIFFPGSNVNFTVGLDQIALSVHLPVLNISVINLSIRKNDLSLGQLVVIEFTFVESFVLMSIKLSKTMVVSFNELTLVSCSKVILIDSLTSSFTFQIVSIVLLLT